MTFAIIILSVLLLIIGISYFKFNTFLCLILIALILGIAIGLDTTTIISTVKAGFGHTMEKIGLLIIFGVILGEILDQSQATLSMAGYILKHNSNTPLAVILIGFIVGLPIFCDSGFIILSGLIFSLSKHQNKNTLVLCLAGSLFAVHCLVPPHPGILAATAELDANLGLTMLMGAAVSIVPTVAFYFYAIHKKPFENSVDSFQIPKAEIPFFSAFLPIMLPIGLMAAKAIVSIFKPTGIFFQIINFVGEPIIGLLIGIAVACPLLRKKILLNDIINSSLSKSGHIIAIVAAGGVFGEVMKKALGDIDFSRYDIQFGLFWVFIPFLLTAFLKSAQGSSTVAIISAVSILEPLSVSMGIDSAVEKSLLLMAMGAGSMVISHANDAYFWVICNFSKQSDTAVLKTYTPMTLLMGISTIITVWVLSLI